MDLLYLVIVEILWITGKTAIKFLSNKNTRNRYTNNMSAGRGIM